MHDTLHAWQLGMTCSLDCMVHLMSSFNFVTCASMAPTPQHRMLSGRCSVSAKVPKVDDTPRIVFCANDFAILFPLNSYVGQRRESVRLGGKQSTNVQKRAVHLTYQRTRHSHDKVYSVYCSQKGGGVSSTKNGPSF